MLEHKNIIETHTSSVSLKQRKTHLANLAGFNAIEAHYYPLVNIQKAIENGHRNSGITH
jgi:hypothetical protein